MYYSTNDGENADDRPCIYNSMGVLQSELHAVWFPIASAALSLIHTHNGIPTLNNGQCHFDHASGVTISDMVTVVSHFIVVTCSMDVTKKSSNMVAVVPLSLWLLVPWMLLRKVPLCSLQCFISSSLVPRFFSFSSSSLCEF